jgi:hypothetical protein
MMGILKSTEISRRQDFGKVLSSRGLNGKAVEVGTHLGEFAVELLDGWRPGELFCVDPWITKMPRYDDIINARPDRDADMAAAEKRLSRFGNRANIIRKTSDDASLLFSDESLDFVYIDANHYREHVEKDISNWLPKVVSGGVMAGHDLFGWEILQIVEAAADDVGAQAYWVPGWYTSKGKGPGTGAASWYFVKP